MKCPRCQSERKRKNGFTSTGKQRYRCADCGKSFVEEEEPNSINVPPNIRKRLVENLLKRKTPAVIDIKDNSRIRKCSNTIYYWRHKILNELIALQSKVVLSGQIQADETYYSVNYKGNHKNSKWQMPRPPRDRSADLNIRGLSREKIAVLTAIDEHGVSIAIPISQGRPKSNEVYNALKNNIAPGSILITDSASCYRKLAKQLNLKLIQIPSGKHTTVVDGVKYHINTLNNYHRRLKEFTAKFYGMSSKFLPEYMAWFSFIDRADLTDSEKKSILNDICRGNLKPVRKINKLEPININKTKTRKKKAKP